MPTIPYGGALKTQSAPTEYPSLTWKIDRKSNRLSGKVDGLEALAQTVDAILNIKRFQWQIYSPNIGIQFDGILGQDMEYACSELKIRIEQALSIDSRILGVYNFNYEMDGDVLMVRFTVKSVLGNLESEVRLI